MNAFIMIQEVFIQLKHQWSYFLAKAVYRYRHTFAKQWIISGGNVVSLSQLLGYSSLEITQNYIHLLVSDVAKQVDEFNVLDKFYSKTHISSKN